MGDLANPPQPKPTQAEADEFMADALGFGDDGGGGEGAWVPSGAKIHIDFLGGTPQGRAWVDGTGAVAVNTLVGADASVNGNLSVTSGYNSANLTANGYHYPASLVLAVIGSAKAKMISGCTVVIRLHTVDLLTSQDYLFHFAGDIESYLFLTIEQDGSMAVFSGGGLDQSSSGSILDQVDNNAVLNGIAATITSTRYEVAANGALAFAVVLTATDRPPDDPFTAYAIRLEHNSPVFSIQSITIYDPLPTTAGLSALSAIPSD